MGDLLELVVDNPAVQTAEGVGEMYGLLQQAGIALRQLPEGAPLSLRGLRWKVWEALEEAEWALVAMQAINLADPSLAEPGPNSLADQLLGGYACACSSGAY
jgi:hypothetical protein